MLHDRWRIRDLMNLEKRAERFLAVRRVAFLFTRLVSPEDLTT